MALILEVTLDLSTKPPGARVEDVVVKKQTTGQRIQWKLVGDTKDWKLAGLIFGPHKPFPDPRDIFGPFIPAHDGKSATMTDTHTDVTTEGTWTYQLELEERGERRRCDTRTTGGNNPNIINK